MEKEKCNDLPQTLDKWNWGAFLLNWIWGIGNNVWVSLLTFVPFFGFIWVFVLGLNGNKWAWEKGKWESIEQFKRVQRNWSIAGCIVYITCLLTAIIVFFSIIHVMNNSWAATNSYMKIKNNSQVQN